MRKMLRLTFFLLGGLILLRFVGGTVLSLFGMGWRCTPRYTMNFLICILGIVCVALCLGAIQLPQEKPLFFSTLVCTCSILSMFMSVLLVMLLLLGMSLDKLNEHVYTVGGQTIVYEGTSNGGVVRRFYLPVNSLIHGEELEYDWNTGLVQMPTGEKVNPYNS